MGKLLLTNKEEWNNELREIFKETGFSVSGENNLITVYKKKKVNNENFYEVNGDYVAAIGTLIYRKRMGEQALKLLYNDSENEDIKKLRRKMWGTYACVIKRGDKIKIFVDEMGTYALYYKLENKKEFVVTNTYYHIAKCTKSKLLFDVLLKKGIRGGVYGNKTPFEGIFRLSENEFIDVDIPSDIFKICTVELNNYKEQFKSKEEAIAILKDCSEQIEKAYSENVKGHVIFATGGLDSRLELALHLKYGNDIKLGYWKGQDSVTNGTIPDLKIGEKIARKKGLVHTCYDVSESFEDSIDSIDEKECDKYGEYASIYAHNRKWFQILECFDSSVQSLKYGYGGELLRGTSEIFALKEKDRDLNNFVRKVYCRNGFEKYIVILNGIYQSIEEEIKSCFEIDERENLTLEDCEKIFDYSRFHADCNINALVNMYYYSYPIFTDKKSWDIISSLKMKWKKYNKIAIKLLEEWDCDMLEIPIYSHHHIMKYDKYNSELKDSLGYCFAKQMQKNLLKTKLYDVLYVKTVKKRIKPHTEKNQEILEICLKKLKESRTIATEDVDIKTVSVCKGFDVTALATFVAQICVADTLFDLKKEEYYENISDHSSKGRI